MAVSAALPKPARSDARLVSWLALVGTLALLNFVGNAEADPDRDFVYLWSSVALGLIQFGVMLAIILAIAGRRQTRDMLALRRPLSWWRALGLGARAHRRASTSSSARSAHCSSRVRSRV